MELPNLPKQNKKKEADSGLRFRSWFEKHPTPISCSLEMKDSRGKDYISYKEITQEQIKSGLANKSDKGNLIRISSGTIGTADYYYLRNSLAYVVIKYPKFFCLIDIETLNLEIKRSDRRSLTSRRAKEIATIVV